jgi:uncharacterized protein YkwD
MFPITLLSFLILSVTGKMNFEPVHKSEMAKKVASPETLEASIFNYVNRDRKAKGLAPLRLNADESAIATRHSRDMASGTVPFGHEGAAARQQAIRSKLGFLQAFGENVAYGQQSAKEVVENWLLSRQHKENIEGNFTQTGIGWAKDANGVLYFTEIFTR